MNSRFCLREKNLPDFLLYSEKKVNFLSPYTHFFSLAVFTTSGRSSSSLLTWSDDGALLAVSAAEGHLADVHVYDVHNGVIFCVVENRANDSTVMSFVPNSSITYRLVCADQMGHFCQYVCFYSFS